MSATTKTARASPSQAATTAVVPAASSARRELGAEVDSPLREQRRPADDDARGRRRRLRRRARRGSRTTSTGRERARARRAAAIARATGCSDACSTRADEPQRLGARRCPAPVTTSTSVSLPSVTVPVLSSTIVSTRRVDSSTSGPLIRMPSCAPRPVPTSSAVGVARPSAHGQATISTATVAEKANVASAPRREPVAERRGGDRDHDRHEDGRDPVGEPLHRRLAGLRVLDELRDLRERRVGADARRLDDEAAADVDRRARDRVARRRPRPGRLSPVSSERSTAE